MREAKARKQREARGRKSRRWHYILSISNRGFRASLVIRRVYQVLLDSAAKTRGLVRVIDESGEVYLYPGRLFVAVELPRAASRAFRAAS